MKKIMFFILLCCILLNPVKSFADMAQGDMIVTLGQDLTPDQRTSLLQEMGAPQNVQIVTVTNQEEHQYLGKYIASSLIGTRAISSSAITIAAPGSGISVKTKNITWVTNQMYVNALITAGVKDASIYITAPVPVSGTAALTGIIKAYEVSSDKVIPEDVKQAANQEMVETAKLGDSIGDNKAAALIAKVKQEMAQQKPQNDTDLRNMIQKAADDLSIKLSDQEMQNLISLFDKLKSANINWNQVNDQLQKAGNNISSFLHSSQGQSFLEQLKQFLISLIDAIKSIFSK